MRHGPAVAVTCALALYCSEARSDDPEASDVGPLALDESATASYAGLRPPAQASPHEVALRLQIAEGLLVRQRSYAELWWRGWLGFYSVGLVVQGTRATFEDDTAQRADLIISAVKAAGGIIRYGVDPYLGIEGLEALGPHRPTTLAERRRRLARAEATLRQNAIYTDERRVWYAHLINIAINAAGGMIVAFAFDDPQTGFTSAGIGAAVGELSLLTQPWQADDDWEDYRRYFAAAEPGSQARLPPRPPRVTVTPGPFGGTLEVVF